jgi:transcriptional regulator of arginine metabolism
MPDAAARRRLLRRLLEEETVTAQEVLAARLAAAGHPASQATVSRDLRAVGAVKDHTGAYRVGPPPGIGGDLRRILDAYAVSVIPSGNLVVVRTRPAAAQMVASALDLAGLDRVIGTVGGDDTVLVVCDGASGGEETARLLRSGGASENGEAS